MEKKKQNNKAKNAKVENLKISQDHEDYGYDFIPNLNEWVNIDEQRVKARELEDI